MLLQVATLIHCSNYYHVPGQEQLAAKLVELSGLTNAFFCSTGLEANEAALKLARKFGHDKGIERPEIIVYEKAFHGRSIATLSATGNPKVQAGFGPLVEGFVRVPLNDLDAIEQVARSNPNVVAVFLETIQGEGGINAARWDYLQGLRAACDRHDWLLMLDEVQCGVARSGTLYAYEQYGIVPDVMIDETEEGNLFAALRTREADLEKHLNSGQGAEQKDEAREKAREEARKKLEEELKKPLAERRMPEYGSEKDFQLIQAINQLKGLPVMVSKTLVERKEEKKEE